MTRKKHGPLHRLGTRVDAYLIAARGFDGYGCHDCGTDGMDRDQLADHVCDPAKAAAHGAAQAQARAELDALVVFGRTQMTPEELAAHDAVIAQQMYAFDHPTGPQKFRMFCDNVARIFIGRNLAWDEHGFPHLPR